MGGTGAAGVDRHAVHPLASGQPALGQRLHDVVVWRAVRDYVDLTGKPVAKNLLYRAVQIFGQILIERVSVSRADFDAVAMAERVPTQSRHHDAGG